MNTQRSLEAWSTVQAGVLQVDGIEKALFDAMAKLKDKEPFYYYMLHHLKEDDREFLKSVIQQGFDNKGSELDQALDEVETYHVLIEAFLRLGFNSEFENDYGFRKRFDKVWSINTLRNSVRAWNVKEPKGMPFIQIEDQALPYLEDLRAGIFNKISELALARNDALDISKQSSGHYLVDFAQFKLHFFEDLLIDQTLQHAKDEL